MDNAQMDGLHARLEAAVASAQDRVAVLIGAGDKAFCAGADLADPPRGLYHGVPGVGCRGRQAGRGAVPAGASAAAWC